MTANHLAIAIAMKPLHLAKQRLRPAIEDGERQALAFAMLTHVLAMVQQSGLTDITGMVSSDPAVQAQAQRYGFSPIPDSPLAGYNAAALRACRWAKARQASTLLLLPADLPQLTVVDIQGLTLLAADQRRALVLAPDRTDMGTNALLLRPPDLIVPCFGPDSFHCHQTRAISCGVAPLIYRSPTLANDVDIPDHLPGTTEWLATATSRFSS